MAQTLVQKSVLDSGGTDIPMPFNQESVTGSNFPLVQIAPGDLGGCSVYHLDSSAATTNAAIVKATPGMLYGISTINIQAAVIYIPLYNITTLPVPGTTAVFFRFAVGSSGILGPLWFPQGIAFSAGIGVSINAGFATPTTAVTVANQIVTLFYK